MKTRNISHTQLLTNCILILVSALYITGCMHTGSSSAEADSSHTVAAEERTVTNEPYYPIDYKDLLIPGELEWNRDKSMTLNTASFSGGILNFSGRVEVNSLTDFFINGMKKDGWELTGSVKAKDVMLAFVKENGSCMIRIFEGYTLGKTEIVIYITHKSTE